MSTPTELLVPFIVCELAAAIAAENRGDRRGTWVALERAHVAAQPMAITHTRVHLRMLAVAWRQRELIELLNQIFVTPFAAIVSLTRLYRMGGGRLLGSTLDPSSLPDDVRAAIGMSS